MATDIAKKIKRDGDIRLRRDLEKLDEPIKADQWRNLYFAKDGRSGWGELIHPTEEAARAAIDEFLADDNEYWVGPEGEILHMDEYSHAIQIPVKP